MIATNELNTELAQINAPVTQENVALKSLLRNLNPSLEIKTVLDLRTICGMDLRTTKSVFPMAQITGVTTLENRDTLRKKIDNVITINIEKDCIPFPSGTIDIILVDQTFNRVKEIYWTVHEATRALRMQGYLIIGIPNMLDPQNNFASQAAIQEFLNAGFPRGYELIHNVNETYPKLPRLLAKILNFFKRNKHTAEFFVLRKTQPYTTGFLDKKINL